MGRTSRTCRRAAWAAGLVILAGCATRGAVKKGDDYMDDGRPSLAIVAYEDALERSPDDPALHLKMAQAYLADLQPERALVHARAAHAGDEDGPAEGSTEVLADTLLQVGEPVQARTMLEMAVAEAPSPERYHLLAQAQLSTGEPDAALASSRRAAEGGDPQALALRAWLLARLGRVAPATEQVVAAQLAGPDDPAVLAECAAVYLLLREAGGAQGAAEAALYVLDDEPERWARQSADRYERGDVEGAIRYAMRVYALDPKGAATAWSLGVWWLQVGEATWAADMLRRALELPPYVDPLATLYDPKLQRVSLADRLEGRRQIAAALADAYAQLGDIRRQIDALEIATKDGDADALFELARAYEQAGMESEAMQTALKASGRDPGHLPSATFVAREFARVGRIDEALGYALPALRRNPGDPELSLLVAQIYAHRREFTLARQTIEQALSLHPTNDALRGARERLVSTPTRRPW